MNQVLKSLFDYQLFEENPSLQECVDTARMRYRGGELLPDELEIICAAGLSVSYGKKTSD